MSYMTFGKNDRKMKNQKKIPKMRGKNHKTKNVYM